MNARIHNVITAIAILLSLLVLASAPAAAQAKKVSANIKGTIGGLSSGAVCPSGYANQCTNLSDCQEVTPAGNPTISGTFGKGTVTDLCFTQDNANNVNVPNDNGHDTCSPLYGTGTIHVSVTKRGVTTVTDTEINFAGIACHHQATSALTLINGGFGINGSSTDPAETGWGTMTGSSNNSTLAFSFKLSGSLTP